MRRKIALLCIMLPLLTCQLHAQEVNDDEEDNTEETTKVSSLLMPNAFSPNGDGINDIYKPKDPLGIRGTGNKGGELQTALRRH